MSDNVAPIKVLHFSSRYEECGVAKYLGHYINGMQDEPAVQNDYFDVSPYKTHHMSQTEVLGMAQQLRKQLKGYDILHIQHEFGLYAHDSFLRIVEAGKRARVKVVITVHTSPTLHGGSKKPRLRGLGPRSWVNLLRESRHHRHFMRTQAVPFRMADALLAHNNLTIEALKQLGVDPDRIYKTMHPVQAHQPPKPTTDIATHLNKQPGDVIFCTTGFIHRYKGIVEAVKALSFLPPNYKLAVLGGMKADSDDVAFYDKVTDLIDTLGVKDRVYIAGYIKSDETLNAYIRECDVSVYPYDRVYYSHVSSGSLNLSFANDMPAIAYPTETLKEMEQLSDGALILCETFAYYELARELQRIDLKKQRELSKAYAQKMSWPKASKELVGLYRQFLGR